MIEARSVGAAAEADAAGGVEFYRHGWHSWCPTGWVDPAAAPSPIADRVDRLGHADPLHAFDELPGGAGVGAVVKDGGEVVLLGALAGGAWVHVDGGRLVGAYEEGEGEWVHLTGAEAEVFGRYAELLAASLGRRGGAGLRLWCSWYSHYESVSEAIMTETLAGLDGLDFDVVQVDDGWQQGIGDWAPNAKFPSGMAAMASRIVDTGRRAGLWLSPFIVRTDTAAASRRAQMVLRDADGEPVVAGENWGGPYWALDVTRLDTLDYLTDLFAARVEDGYTFFKLDFIYAAAFPGACAQPMPRAEAYRRACTAIRRAVGNDVYLLACGAPIVESVGVFDGIRIGPDVGAEWHDGSYAAVAPAMETAVHRLWLRGAIDPDPDVVYFRDTGLREATKHHLQAVAHITGFKGTSDPPGSLSHGQRSALAAFLTERPAVEQLSRYRWRVGERQFDFAAAAHAGATEPQWEEAV